jgi:LAS superfamily LD-carboxypeptidase LdcB
MPYPIAPVVMPADLTGVTNGQLPTNLLRTVHGGGQLHHLAARAFDALSAEAFEATGMGLTYTHGGTYRSYAQQETLFRSRYIPNGAGGGCKSWNGQQWCKKYANLATAATPGTSNHGWGLAVDTAYDSDLSDGVGPDDAAGITGHPGWSWLLANAGRFGFSWELQSEPWHLRYVNGDLVPQAVIDHEYPPTPDPAPLPEDDDMTYLFKLASGDYGVRGPSGSRRVSGEEFGQTVPPREDARIVVAGSNEEYWITKELAAYDKALGV